jgi:hypothetical protein
MAMGTIVTQFVFPLFLCSTVATFSTFLKSPLVTAKNLWEKNKNAFLKPMMKSVADLLAFDCKSFVIHGFTRHNLFLSGGNTAEIRKLSYIIIMQYSPLAIKRRYILGNLADKCDVINKIPVYLNDKSGEPIGFADESMGRYADAFLFHLPEDVCKKLSTNGYELEIDYDVSKEDGNAGKSERLTLNYIILTSKAINSAIPRRHPFTKAAE